MKKQLFYSLLLFFSFFFSYSQFYEGFENTTGPNAYPSTNWTLGSGNWAVFDNGVGSSERWKINNTVATPPVVNSGTNCAFVSRLNLGIGVTEEDYLATPLVTVPINGELRFYSRSFLVGDSGTIYDVMIAPSSASQTNPSAYTNLASYSENALSNIYNIYDEKIIYIPSAYYGQQVYIAFVRKHTQQTPTINADRWLLDDVTLQSTPVAPVCLKPTALVQSNITTNSVKLAWTSNETSTTWKIKTTTCSTGVSTEITVNSNPYIITGLNADTCYKFSVRSVCSNSIENWSDPLQVSTGILPPVCGGLFVDNGGANSEYLNLSNATTTICPTNPGEYVTVTFTSFAVDPMHDGLYVFNGNSTSSPQISSINAALAVPGGLSGPFWGYVNPGPFTSTNPNGCLTFNFRSDGNTTLGGWKANITCSPCPSPNNLTVSGTTTNSLNINWIPTGSATQWKVIALSCNSPAPTDSTGGGFITSNNSFNYTGLTAGSCYKIYVKSICSANQNSEWSVITTNTLSFPSVCSEAIRICDSGIYAANQSNVSAQIGNNYGCLTNTPNPTWFYFGVTNPGTINMQIAQSSSINNSGLDNDYILYGPFTNPVSPCNANLTEADIISCNYSTTSVNNFTIPNALSGQYYLLMVTNYSGQAGYLYIYQTNSGSSAGSTSCSNIMTLTTFLDLNNNGIKDNNELNFSFGQFNYNINNGVSHNIISPNGTLSFNGVVGNSYNFGYTIDPIYSSMYSLSTSNYNNINYQTTGNNNYYFPITLQQNYNDLEVLISPTTNPIAGSIYKNKITYKNNGNQTIANGNLTFTNSNLTSISTISQIGTVANSSGFTYNFTNLLPYESRNMDVTIQVPTIPTISIGNLLINTATITGGNNDFYLINNSASVTQLVAAPYDPNNKLENHGGKIQWNQFSQNEYLYYTINFQNLGTATANNVKIEDLLNTKIDETTIRIISASHNYITDRISNKIIFSFNGINLPTLNQNEALSKGFITFAVKLKPGFAVGDIIPNKGEIYFDTNPAIITNIFNTEFTGTLKNTDFDTSDFVLYPNPASDFVQINLQNDSEKIKNIVLYDIVGKVIISVSDVNSPEAKISTSQLNKGLYLIEITSDTNLKQVKKLIIK